jgi:peptidoglycan hydrolase CwlO-like protein
MWKTAALVLAIVVVLAVLGYVGWNDIGIAPPEFQATSDQITRLENEVKDLQAEVQIAQQQIKELQGQVAGLK